MARSRKPVFDRAFFVGRSNHFKALGDPNRLMLLHQLHSTPGMSTTELVEWHPAKLAQPTVSHHMTTLTGVGLVVRTKTGSTVRYELTSLGELMVELDLS